MKFRHFTALHSDFDSEECIRRLIESIDPDQQAIFSFSGYKGLKPLLGFLNGYEFQLHKRRSWLNHNSFAPQCYGNFVAQEKGTLVECYFDVPRWTKSFMRVWIALVILLGAPIFIISLLDLIKTGDYNDGGMYSGLIAPVALALFFIFLPKIGLVAGMSDEDFILKFLRRILVADVYQLDQDPSRLNRRLHL